MTNQDGRLVNYTYDALNRLTRTQYPDGNSVVYTYDALGRQISMTDWQGTTLYSYDALGRLIKAAGPEINEQISYTYDALGNRVSMTNQDGETVSYGYDSLNRLIAVTNVEGITAYSFDALSNITQISYPNGASINYSYDVMNRPVLVVNKDAQNKKSDVFGYAHDPAGMVTKILQEGGVSLEYAYDALDRLVRETSSQKKKHDVKIKYDRQYSYDAVGNRVEMIEHKGGVDGKQIKETYSYDAGNRLLGLTRNKEKDGLPVLVETVHYSYDNNGNRMMKEETKLDDDGQESEITYYSYDDENRLTNLEYIGDSDENDTLNASFEYDGNGIRRKAVEGDVITRYYYDGLNVLFEKDAAGLTQRSYTRGLGFPGGIGGLISMKRFEQEDDGLQEKISYYHYDALGSVRGLSNQNGKLTAEFDYDAFGNGKDSKPWNAYRFSSKEFEDHAGLYYFGARYYDPEIGRWLTQDPLGFIDGPNRYTYVANNPLNFIDPYGEFAFLALLPVAYAAFEIGLSALDVYSTASTLFNSSASGKEKALSAGLFIAGALAPGGGYSTGAKFTQGQLKQFEKQLAQHGKGSLEKSLASFQKNLLEHQKKLEDIKKAGGYTSSVEKEINNFIQQINTIKKILGGG